MMHKVDRKREAGSKRAASNSPSRCKKARRDDNSSSEQSDGSLKHLPRKKRNRKDKDDAIDSKERKKGDKYKNPKISKTEGNDLSDNSSDESDDSQEQSEYSSENDVEKPAPKEGSRYWGGQPDPVFVDVPPQEDEDHQKGGRYWGGEPSQENLEEGELSSDSHRQDYEVGKRYYSDKSDEKVDQKESEDTKTDQDYLVGSRYYEDKPEKVTKEPEEKGSENKQEITRTAPTRRAKLDDPLLSRTGGAYIPPAKLRLMQANITDKTSISYQRIAWEALKKSIHGHINKVNTSNIGIIARYLMKENIVRGRGLLCRSLLQAQAASPTFTNVYACLVSVINSKFPNIGELLMKRVILQFKRGFKRNDKALCIASCQFIAHLVNQQIAHEILALEMLTLLLESPTDDSVEVAVAFLKEVGQKLLELSPKGTNAIFDMLRNILHQGNLEKRVQYMIEVVFQVRKDGFRSFPSVDESLDLVEEEDRYTHILTLDEAVDPEDMLNVFKHDPDYVTNEDKYKALKEEIIGGSSSEEESGEDSGEESDEETSEDEGEDGEKKESNDVMIIDETETNLVALRRTIYLTIQSSLDFEECCHKLLKMDIKPGQEAELCHMLLDCCAELRTYEKFFGLLAQRFCQINKVYTTPLEEMFAGSYATVHRLDTNKLRNVARFFGHLLFTDAISWQVLQSVRLNEEETTSSSRIFIKILFQELAEYMGLAILNQRLKDPTLQEAMEGLFPRDNPKDTRFAINFFTSIGLGGLTDELREHLKTQPKPSAMVQLVDKLNISSDSSSSSSGSSDESSDSSSTSDSEEENNKKNNKKSKNTTKAKRSEKDMGSKIVRSRPMNKELLSKSDDKRNRKESNNEKTSDKLKSRPGESYTRDEGRYRDKETENRRKGHEELKKRDNDKRIREEKESRRKEPEEQRKKDGDKEQRYKGDNRSKSHDEGKHRENDKQKGGGNLEHRRKEYEELKKRDNDKRRDVDTEYRRKEPEEPRKKESDKEYGRYKSENKSKDYEEAKHRENDKQKGGSNSDNRRKEYVELKKRDNDKRIRDVDLENRRKESEEPRKKESDRDHSRYKGENRSKDYEEAKHRESDKQKRSNSENPREEYERSKYKSNDKQKGGNNAEYNRKDYEGPRNRDSDKRSKDYYEEDRSKDDHKRVNENKGKYKDISKKEYEKEKNNISQDDYEKARGKDKENRHKKEYDDSREREHNKRNDRARDDQKNDRENDKFVKSKKSYDEIKDKYDRVKSEKKCR